MLVLRPVASVSAAWFLLSAAGSLHAAPGDVDPVVAPRFENPGGVRAMVPQPDGKWIVGGDFAFVNGVSRGKIARLHANGTLDTSFDPGPPSLIAWDSTYIQSLSLQGDKVLVAGPLVLLAGQPASVVARLHADGSRDTSFAPPAFAFGSNTAQGQVAIDRGDGKILVGGYFSTVGGQARPHLVRLDTDGAIDSTFNPVLDGGVVDALPVPGNRWIIAGSFTKVSGQAYPGLARIQADGALDPSFAPVTIPASGRISKLALQPDGKIVYAGNQSLVRFVGRALADGGNDPTFTPAEVPGDFPDTAILADGDLMINGPGTGSQQLTRLQPAGGLDPVSQPPVEGYIHDLFANPDGSLMVGGRFTTVGNQLRLSMAKILPDGSVAPDFHPDVARAGEVHRITPLSGDRWLIAGNFSAASDDGFRNPARSVARLNADLTVDPAFSLSSYPSLIHQAAAEDATGRLLLGGASTSSTDRRRILRFNTDGTLDPSFNVQFGPYDSISDIVVQPDGSILAAGNISELNGSLLFCDIVRLLPSGAVDTAFQRPTTNPIADMLVEETGTILVGGAGFLKRLTPDGAVDPGFSPSLAIPSDSVQAIAPASGRRILIAVNYSALGSPVGRISRLDRNGKVDPAFQPGTGANGSIRSLQVRSDGDLMVAGNFTSYNGVPRPGLAQLSPDGALRTDFDPGEGFIPGIQTLAFTTDGELLVGGGFSRAGGLGRAGFAKVETAPLQANAAPTAPGSPIVAPLASGSVLVQWTDSHRETGYFIERRETAAASWQIIAELPAGSTFHQDDSAVPGKVYEYRVLAWNPRADAPVATTSAVTVPDRSGLAGEDLSDGSLDLWAAGHVMAVARQPDGKILIAGDFTQIGNTGKRWLARLNADGSVDPTFTAPEGFTWNVDAIGVQSTGRIIVCGTGGVLGLNPDGSIDPTFSQERRTSATHALAVLPNDKLMMGGGSPFFLVRTHADGSRDTTFAAPGLNERVHALAMQPDGKVVVSGSFSTVASSFVTSVARFHSTGARDTSFASVIFRDTSGGAFPILLGTALAIQSDGKILVGGSFDTVNHVARKGLVRLTSAGAVDTSYVSQTATKDFIRTVSELPDQRIAVGGHFQSFGGTPQSCWVVTESNGSPVSGQADLRGNHVRTALRLPDNKLLLAGRFRQAGGNPHAGLVILNEGGTSVAPAFSPRPVRAGTVATMTRLSGDNVVVTGDFCFVGAGPEASVYRPTVFLLDSTGSLSPGFHAGSGFEWAPSAVAPGNGGRLYFSGEFSSVNGTIRNRIAALNNQGTVITTFNPGAGPNNTVSALVAESDGGVTLAGAFSSVAGTSRTYLARLTSSGSVTSHFNGSPAPDNSLSALLRHADGQLRAGGHFTSLFGSAAPYFAKFLADGTLSSAPRPVPNGAVTTFAPLATGDYFAAGDFTSVSGVSLNRMVKLTAQDTIDASFVPALANLPSDPSKFAAMSPDLSGRLYVAGRWPGTLPSRTAGLVRLTAAGAIDTAFDAGESATTITALASTASGLWVGGTFTQWNGQTRRGIVRLRQEPTLAAPPAPQSFTASHKTAGVTLTWKLVNGATGYLVERLGEGDAVWTPVAVVDAALKTHVDTGLLPGSSWTYRVVAMNAAGRSPTTAALTVEVPASFSSWKNHFGIPAGTGDNDDSDHDGIPLIMEYAIGTTPGTTDQAPFPAASLQGGRLELRYIRLRDDIRYTVETSTQLQQWVTTGVSDVAEGEGRLASVAATGSGPRFLRLSVQLR